jgi:hypothetical protein
VAGRLLPRGPSRRAFSRVELRTGGAEEAEARSEAREADFGEETAVDEEDGDLAAVALGKRGVSVDVHDFPLTRRVAQKGLHLGPHRLAEVTVRPRQKAQPDHAAGVLAWPRATRKT